MADGQEESYAGYKAAFDEIPDADKESYLSTWHEYLGQLDSDTYQRAIDTMVKSFGPEFTSSVLTPSIDVRKPVEVPPIQPRTIEPPEPEWWQKPLMQAADLPVVKPILEQYGKYVKGYVTPAALKVIQPFSPQMRQRVGGRDTFAIPEEERQWIMDKEELPWLFKTAAEFAVDPMSYVGWGIPGMAEKAAAKAGMKGLATGIHALGTVPEEAFIKAANLPVKAAAAGLKALPIKIPQVSFAEFGATGKFFTGKWGKPFEESARTIASNTGTHAFDAFSSLERAGAVTGKPFSQILEDFRMGIPDQELLNTIQSPLQKRALGHFQQNIDKMNMDSWIKYSAKYPIDAQVGMSTELQRLVAKQLGLAESRKAQGLAGLAQRLYNWWRPMVLQTPYYVLQNLVENNVRQVLDGISPIWDITKFASMKNMSDFPVDIQRKIVSIADRLKNKMPEAGSILARTPSSGNITEALGSHLSRGYRMPASTLASYLDDMAVVNTFFHNYNKYTKVLLEQTSPETAKALAAIQELVTGLTGKIEPVLAEHLGQLAISGSTDDFIKALAEIQGDHSLSLARPMNSIEKGVPMAIQDKLRYDLPRLLAKNDQQGIDNLFEELKRTLPQRIESYQKQKMLGAMKEYRNLVKTNMPSTSRTLLTKAINAFKANRVREAEQAAQSQHSLTAFQQAMFDAHVASRQELEDMAEIIMTSEALRGKVTPDRFAKWHETSLAINKGAFASGRELAGRTFSTADVVRHAKDPKKIQSAWDNYIMNIQSSFPEVADGLKAVVTPNNDDLWHAYYQVQERRWFNVGQDKLIAMGLDPSDMAKVMGPDGKILTQADFLKEQTRALKSWQDRINKTRSKSGVPQAANDLAGFQTELGALIPNNTVYKGVQLNYTINKNGFEIDVIKTAPAKWSESWQNAQMLNDIEQYAKSEVGKEFLYHGGGKFGGKSVKSGYLTSDIDEAIMYARDQAKTGKMGEGFVYAINKSKIKAEQVGTVGHFDLLQPVEYERTFDVMKHYPLPTTTGKGAGTAVLNEIGELADKYGVAVKVHAQPLAGSTITQEQLESWYTKHGYKKVGKSTAGIATVMERPAKIGLTKNQILDTFREQVIAAKESIALQAKTIHNQASNTALNTTYGTYGNYAQRTNLDEFMTGMGAPFWFFPSRSIPYYTTQMIKHPRLGIETINMQKEANESEQPSRLFGAINIPGTDYWYNPIQSSMWWQLTNPMARSFNPVGVGGMEQGDNFLRNQLGVSLGPQWKIASALVERVLAGQTGQTPLTSEPQAIIPQQRWLQAVAGLRIPVISGVAAIINEPFDGYLRAVYGDTVAEYAKREVEKTIVDMGHNPRIAPDEVIKAAWDKYYTRQLLSIPGGAVKELNPTEKARFEAINQKSKEMGYTKEQRTTLRDLNESAFTGLRQDQMEAIYKDIPAAKLWRYIRPSGLSSESRPIWQDYIKLKLGRENLLYGTDPDNPAKGSRLYTEQKIDESLKAGRITPRVWKELYRQNYAEYMSKVSQLENDCPKAPKTEQDWEAYRKMLDWKTPVRHPDDIKLDEYYKALDSSIFTDEAGLFDYEKYRTAQQDFLSGLNQDTVDYIQSRKDRYKSPLRATYSNAMAKAQPYYDLEDQVLAMYPPEIKELIDYAAKFSPAIQKAYLARSPQAVFVLRHIRLAKEQYRTQYPEVDRILRFWNR